MGGAYGGDLGHGLVDVRIAGQVAQVPCVDACEILGLAGDVKESARYRGVC